MIRLHVRALTKCKTDKSQQGYQSEKGHHPIRHDRLRPGGPRGGLAREGQERRAHLSLTGGDLLLGVRFLAYGFDMLKRQAIDPVLGRGVYSAAEGVRLLNFTRNPSAPRRSVSRQTVARWLRGYDFERDGDVRHSDPLWTPDYLNDNDQIELSFRDLIELRFVKAFRDLGLTLPAIRECFARAVEEVRDDRPFSTQHFRTDGKTIFLEITKDLQEGELIDLRRRQRVFRTIVAPSLRDLEFDAEAVVRWFPLGINRRSVVIDPARAFGRPITRASGVPTEVLAEAVKIEGSIERVAALYESSSSEVKDAIAFEQRLAA
jgi:uncharacterized protein (DUF433 family)/DNA-binding transcriptional MerR regulator